MKPTEIVMVRHGEVAGITPPRFRGRAALALTSAGQRQAERTRDYVATFGPVAAFYTSPLERCQRTAAIIAKPHGVVPVFTPQLNDIDYGDWQGQSYDEVRNQQPDRFAAWMKAPDTVDIPGGESLRAAAERSADALMMITARHPGETTVLVSHDSIIRLLLLHVLDLPLRRYWDLEQAPCGVSLVAHGGSSWKIRCMNGTAHLAELVSEGGDPLQRMVKANVRSDIHPML